jgi:hypothetical protein
MADGSRTPRPQARRDGLVVRELAEEVLIYDTQRHKAHCLNPMAAAVWRHCDGQTTVGEMARRLQQDLSTPVDRAVVFSALAQLGKARLLAGEVRPQGDGAELSRGPGDEAGLSRRELMRLLGGAAASIPLVTTIAAPAAAQAVSCLGELEPCDPSSGPPCCPGLTCLTSGSPPNTLTLCCPPI